MVEHRKLEPGDAFGPVLLASLFRLATADMRQAIERNSAYRENAAVQWATLLARRARERRPELKEGE